jgi:hypothetical protein
VPIPLTTTTITVLRQAGDPYGEPYDLPNTVEVETGIRAVIDISAYGVAAGQEVQGGGEQTRTVVRLICDPCDITSRDWVRDDGAGQIWRVLWVVYHAPSHELAHVQGGLETVEGLV